MTDEQHEGAKVNVLLVEDDAMLAEAVGDGVRQQGGWKLEHAADAAAAKMALLDHTSAIVLLDFLLEPQQLDDRLDR